MKVCCCTDCRLLRDDFERADLAPAVSSLDEAVAAIDEVQTIHWWVTPPTGGTWTISYDGETTDDLAYDADAAAVQAALESLPNIGAGNIAVAGMFGSLQPITFTFEGDLGGTDVPLLTADFSNLTGQGGLEPSFSETTKGAPAVPELVHWSIDGGAAVCSTDGGTLTWSDLDGGPDGQTGRRYRFRARVPAGAILNVVGFAIEPAQVTIDEHAIEAPTSAGAWHSYEIAQEMTQADDGHYTLRVDGEPVAALTFHLNGGWPSPPIEFDFAAVATDCGGGEVAIDDVKVDALGDDGTPCERRTACIWPVGARELPDSIVLTIGDCDADSVDNCADLSAINRAWHLELQADAGEHCAEYRVDAGAGCGGGAVIRVDDEHGVTGYVYGSDESHLVVTLRSQDFDEFAAAYDLILAGVLDLNVYAGDGTPHGCTATLEVE